MLQVSVSLSEGHGTPPYASWITMVLVRVCVPLPQVTVHVSKLDQADTTQSIGQGSVLQTSVSLRLGQSAPPYAA